MRERIAAYVMSEEKRSDAREVSPGVRVRVTSGAFAGKTGVVAEPDGKGGVMVVLGQLTVRVTVEELELAPLATRDRPVMGTSHMGKRAGKKAR
jgi:transcription antitermination factor NusG